jgi:hypothetical protein
MQYLTFGILKLALDGTAGGPSFGGGGGGSVPRSLEKVEEEGAAKMDSAATESRTCMDLTLRRKVAIRTDNLRDDCVVARGTIHDSLGAFR